MLVNGCDDNRNQWDYLNSSVNVAVKSSPPNVSHPVSSFNDVSKYGQAKNGSHEPQELVPLGHPDPSPQSRSPISLSTKITLEGETQSPLIITHYSTNECSNQTNEKITITNHNNNQTNYSPLSHSTNHHHHHHHKPSLQTAVSPEKSNRRPKSNNHRTNILRSMLAVFKRPASKKRTAPSDKLHHESLLMVTETGDNVIKYNQDDNHHGKVSVLQSSSPNDRWWITQILTQFFFFVSVQDSSRLGEQQMSSGCTRFCALLWWWHVLSIDSVPSAPSYSPIRYRDVHDSTMF